MKTIIYSCPFVPAEWIAAHGMRPCRIVPRFVPVTERSSMGGTSGVCPYTRAFVNHVLSETEAAAVVVTTVCDQMRRGSELIAGGCDMPVFLMNVPSTWQTTVAHKMYMTELERLGRFMVRLGGKSPSRDELVKVMCEYDMARSGIQAARGHLSARQYSEAIADFHRNGRANFTKPPSESMTRGIPLALVGGPLLLDHFHIFDLIEMWGGCVVLIATENGERSIPPPFDRRQLKADPVAVLADAYFGSIPDAFRRPNSELYRWLKREMSQRGVSGIILWRYVWCDTWHAEVQRMREWANLPLLDLDASDDADDVNRTASRIQSFMEMLQ